MNARIRGWRDIGGLVAAILMMCFSQEGFGEEPPPVGSGHLTAIAGAQVLPRGARIRIEPGPDDPDLGDAPLYVVARAVVGRELTRRGFQPGDTADLTLELRVSVTGYHGGRRRDTGVFPKASPPPGAEEDRSPIEHQLQVPLKQRSERMPSRVTVELVLYRPVEAPLWSATVTAADHVDSAGTLVARLTKAAMAVFGASAQRSFVLSCDDAASARRGLCLE